MTITSLTLQGNRDFFADLADQFCMGTVLGDLRAFAMQVAGKLARDARDTFPALSLAAQDLADGILAGKAPDDLSDLSDDLVDALKAAIRRAPLEVGQGVSISYVTDEYPATVVKVCSPSRVWVTVDDHEWIAEEKRYEYTRRPDGKRRAFSLRKNGRWVEAGRKIGQGCTLGIAAGRSYYRPREA